MIGRGSALALSAALLAGCITEERIPDAKVRKVEDKDGGFHYVATHRVRNPNDDPNYTRYSEDELKAATATHPEDARAWWQLGDFYERKGRYLEALDAYQKLQERIEAVSKRTGRPYIGGLFLIGKAHLLCGQYPEAVGQLGRVLEHKPANRNVAASVPQFREAHFLLGTIYFTHRDWALAEEHLQAYESMTGDVQRVAGMLAKIERELHPERLSHATQASSDLARAKRSR